jgi:hypothetical protein
MTALLRTGKRRKSQRRRLASAEVWMQLAMTTERWKAEVTDNSPRTTPFAEWPDDDPLKLLCTTYDLTPADLAKLLDTIGAQLEARATRAGYDETETIEGEK